MTELRHPPAVVLVGFMGAGKSAVGRALAERLGLPFKDTDDLIEASFGPIHEIFRSRGEPAFRALEAEVVLGEVEALAAAPKVLALGGGAVLSDDVRAALQRLERVVWLSAPAEELWRRVTGDAGAGRPLARDEASFRALLSAREPLYRDVCTRIEDTSAGGPPAVAERLAAWLLGESTTAAADGAAGRGAA